MLSMGISVLAQKLSIREIPKLRRSAKNAPYCFSCERVSDGTLVLSHSNSLRLGRGSYFKSPDYFGAIVCGACHSIIDGAVGGLSKEEKRDMHQRAHEMTLSWWMECGILK
jgi:hypothetical protein